MAHDPREVFGWITYDWANSAFQTTVVTVLAGPYLTALAQGAVGENGTVLSLGPLGAVTAKSLFPYCVSLSVLLQVVLLPSLGAVADYTDAKKRLMAAFCYIGVVTTCLFLFATHGRYLLGAALFVVSNLSFGASIVLYNAFLNEVTTGDQRDRVSSLGYAFGYLGGGLLLALNLVLLTKASAWGLATDLAVRISIASAGVWWGGFSLITFSCLRVRPARQTGPEGRSMLGVGMHAVSKTLSELGRLPHTLRFLVAYMAYNDGIQTVIAIASVVLAQELFVAKGLPVDNSFLVELILMIQVVACGGALIFERVAARIRSKRAILVSLVLWIAVVVYAYATLRNTFDAWLMGGALAVVLGGSQALSRSLFSLMIPPGREASFFGLYEISERGTSWIGPLIFGAVVGATGSYRQAILSLVVLFVIGIVLLAATDTDEAIRQANL